LAIETITPNGSYGGGIGVETTPPKSSTSAADSSGGNNDEPEAAEEEEVSKKSDIVDRYHTVNRQLEDMTKAMEKASKAADKLWSRKRLQYLKD
jgi:hypothetical protein